MAPEVGIEAALKAAAQQDKSCKVKMLCMNQLVAH